MIASMIKDGRTAKGLTQKELAEQTSISHRSIQRIESGKVNPRFYTLKKLSEHLDLSLDQLIQQSEELEEKYGKTSIQKIQTFVSILAIVMIALTFFPKYMYDSPIFWIGVFATMTGSVVWIWKR